jgi:hypothetical protein
MSDPQHAIMAKQAQWMLDTLARQWLPSVAVDLLRLQERMQRHIDVATEREHPTPAEILPMVQRWRNG